MENYLGIKNAYYISHGAYSDPEIVYEGWSLNAIDIFEIACSEMDDDYEPDACEIECALMDSQAAFYELIKYEIEHDAKSELKNSIRDLYFEKNRLHSITRYYPEDEEDETYWQGPLSIDQMIDVAKDYLKVGFFRLDDVKQAMQRDIENEIY